MNGGSYFLIIDTVPQHGNGRSQIVILIVSRLVTVELRVGDGDISGAYSQ